MIPTCSTHSTSQENVFRTQLQIYIHNTKHTTTNMYVQEEVELLGVLYERTLLALYIHTLSCLHTHSLNVVFCIKKKKIKRKGGLC